MEFFRCAQRCLTARCIAVWYIALRYPLLEIVHNLKVDDTQDFCGGTSVAHLCLLAKLVHLL